MNTRSERGRIACVDLPFFELQLLRRTHPEWAGAPLAVVEDDHPQARILAVDRIAMAHRVRVGMRYAAALSLCSTLRAGAVDEASLGAARDELVHALLRSSPRVEPDLERPGVFFLDPSGLGSLFGPLERWARRVHKTLEALRWHGAVVVGFARLAAWAIARGRTGPFVLESAAEEAERAGRTPLLALGIEPEIRDALLALGITTLEGWLALPRGEVGVRFGPRARELHALFADALRPPLTPSIVEEPIEVEAELDPPDADLARLLFCIKGGLHALIAELALRALALGALAIRFDLERDRPHHEHVEPAAPTRDAIALLELVRLRLAARTFPSRIERVVLTAEPTRLDGRQLALFAGRRRDPDAAARGIARIRAAFGDDAVTRAELRDAWLPEKSFAWVPIQDVEVPKPIAANEARLVRRLFARPTPLGARDGRPQSDPPIAALVGPYRLQGGFWTDEVVRDYFFAERTDGATLWLFHDRREDRWYVHGRVD